jgi:hypothetical protein
MDAYDTPASVPTDEDQQRLRAAVCDMPKVPPRDFGAGFDPDRARAILVSDKKWANGTHLRYHFLGQPRVADDVEVVRAAFRQWRELPIGLVFSRSASRSTSRRAAAGRRWDGTRWGDRRRSRR